MFWKLGAPALMDPDEAHYAQLTREMLRAGNWMIPLLDGLPYIDKPVLFHWLQGLAIAVLGETEAAMRLPSAIAAIALFWMTRWTGEQLFDERIGVRAWLMLATLPLTFMLGSIGVFDMVFTAFLFGAIAVRARGGAARPAAAAVRVVRLAEPRGDDEGAGRARACRAVLSRRSGVRQRVPHGAALAALGDRRGVDRGAVAAVVRVDVLRAGVALRASVRARRQPVLHHAAAVVFESRVQSHAVRLDIFRGFLSRGASSCSAARIDTIRRWRARIKIPPEEILLWAWVGVVFVFFSLARFKVDRYVYPAAPACCLLAARAWMSVSVLRPDLATARDNMFARWSVAALGIILVAVGVVSRDFRCSTSGSSCRGLPLLMPISLAAGGAGARDDDPSAQRPCRRCCSARCS